MIVHGGMEADVEGRGDELAFLMGTAQLFALEAHGGGVSSGGGFSYIS